MKIAIISLALILFAVGCSKKESATAPLPFALAHGDLGSPVEIVPDKIGARSVYRVPWKLSTTKLAALCKVAQSHPNRSIEIMAGARVVAQLKAPADVHDADPSKVSNMSFQFISDSQEDARLFAESLRELSK